MLDLAVLLPLLIAAAVSAARWFLHYKQFQADPVEAKLQEEIARLKVEKGKLSVVSDFVEVSKLERSIVKLEKQVDAEKKATAAARGAAYGGYGGALRNVQVALYAVVLALHWSTPVATLPPWAAFPFGWLLSLPGRQPGTIGMGGWCFLCHLVVTRVADAIAAATGLAALGGSEGGLGGMLGKLMGMATGGGGGR